MEVYEGTLGDEGDARVAQITVHTAQDGLVIFCFDQRIGDGLIAFVRIIHRDGCECRAAVERTAVDGSDACGDVQCGHSRVVLERVCGDLGERVGEGK